MKERPIPVRGPEVRAILDGRMKRLRRIIKPQPQFGVGRYAEDGTPGEVDWVLLDEDGDPMDSVLRCPYGAPGDRLWVRETHALAAPVSSRYRLRLASRMQPRAPNFRLPLERALAASKAKAKASVGET